MHMYHTPLFLIVYSHIITGLPLETLVALLCDKLKYFLSSKIFLKISLMFFDLLILITLIGNRDAASLLDGELVEPGYEESSHEVLLFNRTQSASISYFLLYESRTLGSHIAEIEMKHKERAIQNKTGRNVCADNESFGEMEFTGANRIKKMKMPDYFDIKMLEEITEMRKIFVKKISKISIGDTKQLYELLNLYVALDFWPNIRYAKQNTLADEEDNITVDKNIAFAVNMVVNLASYGRWEHYKELLTVADSFGPNHGGEEAFLADGFYLSMTQCDMDRKIIELFNRLPVLRAAIILCTINKDKEIVVKHPDFKIISEKNAQQKPYTIIREKPNNDEIVLSEMPVFREEPKILRIMLPAHNFVDYFKFIRNYLCLTDSIESIIIVFYDSERAKKYNNDVHTNTQQFLEWVVEFLLSKEIVPNRPQIRSFGIYGYDLIDVPILASLAKIPLQGLSLLGTDSTLDYFYLFKLFESECPFKSNIQKFSGTFGAAVLLNELMGRRQISNMEMSVLMQFKTKNLAMIKKDSCWERLSAYFAHGDLHALPEACSKEFISKNHTRKLELLRGFISHSEHKLCYLRAYNTSAESIAEIAKEIKVTSDDIYGMTTFCMPSDFNLITAVGNDSIEATITVEHYTKTTTLLVLQELALIEDKDTLIIEYLRPLTFKSDYTRSQEKKDLVQLLTKAFHKWITCDASNKHKLIFKVAETNRSCCSLRDIFTRAYYMEYSSKNFTKYMERVTFIKI
ncbi:hypothetical protein ENBRE01_1266 [Enteropsectra breve]|nr:hypothetical protein ENBRE01_1266 [Enteropsectra breve]